MNLYATKTPKGKWGLLRNKAAAIRQAKEIPGAEVWSGTDVPEINTWDWPTFRIGAVRVYPVEARDILRDAYRQAAEHGYVHSPDYAAIRRAAAAYAGNCQEPGDCADKPAMLLGLAIAEADIGRGPGWIPAVQAVGVKIAKLFAHALDTAEI